MAMPLRLNPSTTYANLSFGFNSPRLSMWASIAVTRSLIHFKAVEISSIFLLSLLRTKVIEPELRNSTVVFLVELSTKDPLRASEVGAEGDESVLSVLDVGELNKSDPVEVAALESN